MPRVTPAYAELQITTNFSFLRGASHPQELAVTAAALDLKAFAITDLNTLGATSRQRFGGLSGADRLSDVCSSSDATHPIADLRDGRAAPARHPRR